MNDKNNENVFEVFDSVINSVSVKQLLQNYHKLNQILSLNPLISSLSYFTRLKNCLSKSKQILKYNKISSIVQKLDKRSQHKQYHNNRPLNGQRVLVIGGGISGLRVAIELLLLGASVTCVEKRDTFSRNNVIHLWPNVISDLRLLGAKRFYGQFCVGAIDHIAIRQLQVIELKIALIFGLKFVPNVTFDRLCPQLMTPTPSCGHSCGHSCHCCCHSHGFGGGANAHFLSSVTNEAVVELNAQSFDVIIGSDGRRNTLFQDFPRKEFRGKLAIAITANFVNRRTEPEVRVPEISGVSYIYAQKWFRALLDETGIQLENICYYRNETHYFVMTATKQSLLARNVLKNDFPETHRVLSDDNINRSELLRYARDAAHWTSGLRDLEFAQNALNSADVALFDFTSVYASRNASRAKRVHTKCCQPVADGVNKNHSKYVLMLLTGDSLLEPFWPTGSGAGRGFLSALDAAYTCLQWALKVRQTDDEDCYDAMVDVIAERESVYRLLAQTTPENISSKEFSLLPQNRYTNWSKNSVQEIRQQIRHLIGFQTTVGPNDRKSHQESMAAKRARRATVAVTTRDFNDSQSAFEKNRATEELEFEIIRRELEGKRLREQNDNRTTRAPINRKADWLFGSTGGGASEGESVGGGAEIGWRNDDNYRSVGQNRQKVKDSSADESRARDDRQRLRPKEPKAEIIERAQRLEQMLCPTESGFEPKLSRVGKIEENDWNFRVWSENTLFEPKTDSEAKKSPKPALKNSREILKSRKTQIEAKLSDTSTTKAVKQTSRDKQWIQRMSEELAQRMTKDSGNRFPEPEVKAVQMPAPEVMSQSVPSSSMPRCGRCGLDVTAMERISVSGDILHRSCLRCSKCGISLRLNEFRNELKFLCIYCLKTNQKSLQMKSNSNAKKELFLQRIESIDFRNRDDDQNGDQNDDNSHNRERIEFENKSDQNGQNPHLSVVSKTALNATDDQTDDKRLETNSDSEELTFDLTESDDNSSECDINSTTSDDSEEWETQSEDGENELPIDTTGRQLDDKRATERQPETNSASIEKSLKTLKLPKVDTSVNHFRSADASVVPPVVPPVLCRPRTRRLLSKLFAK